MSLYKLKNSQQVYSIQTFQNGRFALLEIPSLGKQFSLQDRFERCLFLSATVHELKKVCEICLVGKSLGVSLPLFWISACSQNIFKTIKGTNSPTEAAENSSSDIPRRYSSDGKSIRRNFMSRDTLIFLLQHLDFVINLKKSVLKPSQQIFRPKNRYPHHHDFGTNTGKDEKDYFEMSESPFLPTNHCFGINKIDRSDVLNCLSSSASFSIAKVFTTTTNKITKPGLFIPGRDSIKQSVKTGTSFVGGKFKIKQWKIT